MPTVTNVWTDVHQERQALFRAPRDTHARAMGRPVALRRMASSGCRRTHGGRDPHDRCSDCMGLTTSGFRVNRYIAKDARERGAAPAAKLLEDFRDVALTRTHLPGRRRLPCPRTSSSTK